nr:hypothetical protein [uncultured Draconibacterium sp.]
MFQITVIWIILSLVTSCNSASDSQEEKVKEQLHNIEAIMLQKPDSIEFLVSRIDTTKLSVHDRARLGTISGLIHSNNGEFQKSINELEKAELVFEDRNDDYHLHINKLIRAFVFEQLSLSTNATDLYIECESYFEKSDLLIFKFFASLGVLRMANFLKLSKEEKINNIQKEFKDLDEPIYKGLFYAAKAYVQKSDSLRILDYENARNQFIKAKYWSRVFGMDLNILFLKIKKNEEESVQKYYNTFLDSYENYSLSVYQKLQYNYGQAYIYILAGRNQEAVPITQKVLNDAKKFDIPAIELNCLQSLSILYRRLGDSEKAYKTLKDYSALKEKTLSGLQKNQLLALGAHYRYSELDRERLNLKVQIQKILIVTTIIISLSLLIFFITWFRLRLHRQHKEILKLENIEIKDQIDKLLGSLEKAKGENSDLIVQVKRLKDQYTESQDVTEFLKALKDEQIKTWMEYEAIFVKLKPGWIEKLKNDYPQLSPTDIKYCMCLYFNLNNHTISSLCEVGVDAIKSAKKRIRDKLLLNEASEIYFFLKEIR